MDKSPEAFRTISEVAEVLETPAHVLRFWETRFPQIRPVKRAGGRRYYRPSDVALLTGIKRLLHEDGLTIRGVQKILREQGIRHVAGLPTTSAAEEAALEAALLAMQAEDDSPNIRYAARRDAGPAELPPPPATTPMTSPGGDAPEDNIIAFPSESELLEAELDPRQILFSGFEPDPADALAAMLIESLPDDAPQDAVAEDVPEAPFIEAIEAEDRSAEIAHFPSAAKPGQAVPELWPELDPEDEPEAAEAGIPAASVQSDAAPPQPEAPRFAAPADLQPIRTQIPQGHRESHADQTLAARLRALPPGALAANAQALTALAARFAALHARMDKPNSRQ